MRRRRKMRPVAEPQRSRQYERPHHWKSLKSGDAWNRSLTYFQRDLAQRMFYDETRTVMKAAAAVAGADVQTAGQFKAQPQLGPCYAQRYPSQLSAYAAQGLSAVLEFRGWTGNATKLLSRDVPPPDDPALADLCEETYARVVELVAGVVEKRLLLESLAAKPETKVQFYWLFMAAHQNLSFDTLLEVLRAAILFGDVLLFSRSKLHGMTRQMFDGLMEVSVPFQAELRKAKSNDVTDLANRWVAQLCWTLARHLPRKPQSRSSPGDAHTARGTVFAQQHDGDQNRLRPVGSPGGSQAPQDATGGPQQANAEEPEYRYASDTADAELDWIPPLNQPHAPALPQASPSIEKKLSDLLSLGRPQQPVSAEPESHDQSPTQELADAVRELQAVVEKTAQQPDWQDIRSDRIERMLLAAPFEKGPIEGQAADGHEIQVNMQGGKAGGQIHDRTIEPSDDLVDSAQWRQRAEPVTSALKRLIFPTTMDTFQRERMTPTGSLDPSRLPLLQYSDAVFRLHRVHRRPNRRGKAVVAIACDGSGSLNQKQMQMVKILATGWLEATARMQNIKVLAGLYHSGRIHEGVTGPLVQWMRHPNKTAGLSPRESVRCVAALPESGTGVQSDAISLAFILDQAQQIAKGNAIYLIVISDCAFNRSFQGSETAAEEVAGCLEDAYVKLQEKLHVTLVTLGKPPDTVVENMVDKVMRIDPGKLDAATAAQEIATYVGSCLRERRRLLAQSHE